MAAYDELRELVVAGAKVGNLVSALADGPGLDDLDEAVVALTAVATGVTGADQALELLKAGLTPEQFAGLVATFEAEFDFANDEVEEAVEDAIKVVVALGEFIAKRQAA